MTSILPSLGGGEERGEPARGPGREGEPHAREPVEDLHVARHGCVVGQGGPRRVAHAQVGPEAVEEDQALEGPGLRGVDDGWEALVVPEVHVGAAEAQHADQGRVAGGGGDAQRGEPAAHRVALVDVLPVPALRDQHGLDAGRGPGLGAQEERGLARVAAGARVGAAVEERRHDLGLPGLGGIVEGGPAGDDVGGAHEGHGGGAGEGRRGHGRCQQAPEHVEAGQLGGVEERRAAVLVDAEQGGPGLEQGLARGPSAHVASTSGVMPWASLGSTAAPSRARAATARGRSLAPAWCSGARAWRSRALMSAVAARRVTQAAASAPESAPAAMWSGVRPPASARGALAPGGQQQRDQRQVAAEGGKVERGAAVAVDGVRRGPEVEQGGGKVERRGLVAELVRGPDGGAEGGKRADHLGGPGHAW
jgi:hypothetical protein